MRWCTAHFSLHFLFLTQVNLFRVSFRFVSGQEPSSKGIIDSEGIDAKGGPDTAGIYGFAREIIEKEEAQAPFRRLRLISYAVPAFVSAPECTPYCSVLCFIVDED